LKTQIVEFLLQADKMEDFAVKRLLLIIITLAMLLAACRGAQEEATTEPEYDHAYYAVEEAPELPELEPSPESEAELKSEPEPEPAAEPIATATIPYEATAEDLGITLEFVRYTHPRTIDLVITNNSGFDVRYTDRFELSGDRWGFMGQLGEQTFDLPPGQQREIEVEEFFNLERGGEFVFTTRIEVGPAGSAREIELRAEFAIDDPTIPAQLQTAAITIELATPVGAVVAITNGFSEGRLYYGRNYMLQRNVGGTWQNVPRINASNPLPPDTRSLGPRQANDHLVRYWVWLYGELPAGQYRIVKTLLHDTGEGELEQVVRRAEFTLDGQPVPESVQMPDGASWFHPFGSTPTLRAQAIEFPENLRTFYTADTLLVRVPDWMEIEGEEARASIWDNHTVTVLDANGNQIPFSEIPVGAVLDITHTGFMLLPAIPPIDALLIEIVE